MNELGMDWIPLAVMALALMSVLLFIMLVVQGVKLRKLRKRYNTMMNGTEVHNLEELLTKMHMDMEGLQLSSEEHQHMISAIQQKQKQQVAQLGMLRYNAFEDKGSNLSFSIALLNDLKDGFVLTGIHGREQMYMYAKPIEKGESKYALSPEEKKAIDAVYESNAK